MGKLSPSLEITLLGAPGLAVDGHTLEGLRRKNRALAFYLAAHEEAMSRDHLLAFFWPDHERAAAQPILRTMIHDLREQPGDMFLANDQRIGLAENALIDVHVLSKAINSSTSDVQQLTAALTLYRGDFLEGFSLANSPQFDDWASSERERYRLLAMRGFANLSRLHESTGDHQAALECMRRALAFNLYQEDLQRDLMRLLYLTGDRAGVIRQYETLRKSLDEEMGVPPMPETRASCTTRS